MTRPSVELRTAASGTSLAAALEGSMASAVLAALRKAFVAVDDRGTVLAWNPAAEALFGWSAEEVVGSPLPLLSEKDRVRFVAADSSGSERLPNVIVRARRDGTPVTFVVEQQLSLQRPNEDGRVSAWLFREAAQDEVALNQRNILSQALVEAVRVDEVRQHVARAVTGLLGADRAVVLAPGPDREHLHGRVALCAHQEDAEQLVLELADPGAAQRAATRRTLEAGKLVFGRDEPEPTLFVPMGPSQVGWVLALVYSSRGLPTSGDLLQLARAVADETWAALRRVELVAELEGKVEILEATTEVASSAGLDLKQVLEAVCRHAAAALSCERAAVYLRPQGEPDVDNLELAHFYASDYDVLPENGEDSLVGQGAAAELFRRAEPVVVQEAAACPYLDGPWDPGQGTVSVFGLPLRVGDRDIGILIVAHTVEHPRGFTNLCQQVGGAIAQQAALAIDNARLFANEREAVRRLCELDRLQADYVAGISHDLRTPLTGLLGFVKTLRRTDQAATPQERHEYLEIMERQANRLANMVGDLLMSAQLEAGGLDLDVSAEMALDELVNDALAMLDLERRARVEVSTKPNLLVRGDRSELLRALGNLLDNALRYSPAQAPVKVTGERVGEAVALAVADTGPGIPAEELPQLFLRYRQGGGRQGGSVGLGLYITHGIVTSHGGRITVDTAPGEGATFTIWLPAS